MMTNVPPRSIILDNVSYTHNTLTDLLEKYSGETDWISDIIDFLTQWFDETEEIHLYTSGSTGVPKQIALSKAMMWQSAAMTNAFFQMEPCSNALLVLSAKYIAGKMMLVRAMQGGYNLYIQPPSSVIQVDDSHVIDLIAVVPMQLEKTIEALGLSSLHSFRNILVGGAPVSSSLEKQLTDDSLSIFASYGMTETASHIALRRVGHSLHYQALAGVSFAQDERGCLIVNVPHLLSHPIVTNDVVTLGNGTFQWHGRADFVINSGGVKLHPEQIERKIEAVMSTRFYITSQPHPLLGESVVLVIESEPLSKQQEQELNQRLIDLLHTFERPKRIVCRACFNETQSGKLIRTKIDI